MVTKIKLREWERFFFRGLKITPKDEAIIKELESRGSISIKPFLNGVEIETKSFVGGIKFSTFQLEIVPKVEETRNFLKMFSYTMEVEDIATYDDYFDTFLGPEIVTDILCLCFLKEVDLIIKKGLLKRYRRKDEALSFLRGKIDFAKMANRASRSSMTLPCIYDDLTPNVLENKIIMATLDKIYQHVSSQVLKNKTFFLKDLLGEEINKFKLSEDSFQKLKYQKDRLGNYYEKALELSYLIFQGLMLDTEGIIKNENPCFLINMNYLFEKFIGKILKETAPKEFKVFPQKVVGDYWDWNNKRRKPMIPDFQFFSGQELQFIGDAKYKPYDVKEIQPSDIYQLTVYSLVGNCQKAIAYYPSTRDKKGVQSKRFFIPVKGDKNFHIVFIGVFLEEIIDKIGSDGLSIKEEDKSGIWRKLNIEL